MPDNTQEPSFDEMFAEATGTTLAPESAHTPEPSDELPLEAPAPAEAAAAPAEPAPQDAPAAVAAPVAPAAPAANALGSLDELLALVPEDRRQAAAPLIEEAKRNQHRLASETGRQAALQRLYMQQRQTVGQLQQELSQANARLAQASTAQERASARADVAEAQDALSAGAAELQKEFPELVKPVQMLVQDEIRRQQPPTQAAPADAEPARNMRTGTQSGADEELAAMQEGYDTLTQAHADWPKVIRDPKFTPWLSNLPDGLKRLADSDDPADAGWLIGQFKREQSEAQRRQEQAQASTREALQQHVAPPRGTPVRTSGGGAATFDDLFNEAVAVSARR